MVNPSHDTEKPGSQPHATDDSNSAQSAIDAALESAAGHENPARTENLAELRNKAGERDEFLRLLQHVRADFANYQKRVQKEIDTARKFATQPMIVDLLPAIDNLERALQAADATGPASGLIDGIRLVHQNMLAALARHGVQPIAASGLPFDPDFHQALMEQPSADQPPRTVLGELQKGYTLHDRVIRPAQVIVSAASQVDTVSKTDFNG